MGKIQFWILNLVGGVCALLLLINLVLIRLNEQTNQAIAFTQQQITHAEQMQTTIQNLAVRIAQAGQTDPALSAVLVRQDLRVTLNTPPDASTKPKP